MGLYGRVRLQCPHGVQISRDSTKLKIVVYVSQPVWELFQSMTLTCFFSSFCFTLTFVEKLWIGDSNAYAQI